MNDEFLLLSKEVDLVRLKTLPRFCLNEPKITMKIFYNCRISWPEFESGSSTIRIKVTKHFNEAFCDKHF